MTSLTIDGDVSPKNLIFGQPSREGYNSDSLREAVNMIPTSNGQVAIIRTELGLTIADTRITLYDVMDHLAAGST